MIETALHHPALEVIPERWIPPFDRLQDDIELAVNYVELCRTTRQFVHGRAYRLIETLASELVSWLLEKFPLRAAEVEVRKFVLPGTKYVSATVRREVSG